MGDTTKAKDAGTEPASGAGVHHKTDQDTTPAVPAAADAADAATNQPTDADTGTDANNLQVELDKAREELAALKQSQMSDVEKSIVEAREQGAADARAEMLSTNVNVFIAARVQDPEAAAIIRESINPSAFVSDDGTIDDVKLSTYLSMVGSNKHQRDPHQGVKQKLHAPSAIEQGRAEAARRFKSRNS